VVLYSVFAQLLLINLVSSLNLEVGQNLKLFAPTGLNL